MAKNVLISGGTGLVGTEIIQLLKDKGYEISLLSRSSGSYLGCKKYTWDINKGEIDKKAVENADYIIHLAGANVGSKKWTSKRKNEILKSRTLSTNLLSKALSETKHNVKSFISASAVGIYDQNSKQIQVEEQANGSDFLANVVKEWESAVDKIRETGIKTIKIRIGVVLSEEGGALPQMTTPVKMLAGAPLGSGEQFMSWIHIHDLARIFHYSIENSDMDGVYNGVAPNPVKNKEMTQAIAKILHKPLFLPNVPAFVLKGLMGEMAVIALEGAYVSSEKLEKTGFEYQFPELKPALEDLLLKRS